MGFLGLLNLKNTHNEGQTVERTVNIYMYPSLLFRGVLCIVGAAIHRHGRLSRDKLLASSRLSLIN